MKTLATGELILDFYEITSEIGQGVNGVVYGAVDVRNDTNVAIKHLYRGQGALAGGVTELSNILQVRHPNVVQCLDFYYGEKGETYLIFEFVRGGNLREQMEGRAKPWSRNEVYSVARQILQALGEIHRNKMIHGDLKPENILLGGALDEAPQVKIADLGTAIHAPQNWIKDRQPKGSPAYMAPERFYDKYSFSADLYALGILLYELLVGDLPFLGDFRQIAAGHLGEAPCFEKIEDARWTPFLNSLLEKDPMKRIQSSGEALSSLELIVNGTPSQKASGSFGSINSCMPEMPESPFPSVATIPYPLSDYELVHSFQLPYKYDHYFAIGDFVAPAILCCQNSFLTRYEGLSGSVQGFFIAAHGDTTVVGREGGFLFAGPGGVFNWQPRSSGGDFIFRHRQEIPTLSSGATPNRFCWSDQRRLHFVSKGQEFATKNLRCGGIAVGLFQLEDGKTLLFEGAAPTRFTLYDRDAAVLEQQSMPGCLIATSKYPEVQAVFLERAGDDMRSGAGNIRLFRYNEAGVEWINLPNVTAHFQFLQSGFLWVDVDGQIQLLDHDGEVRVLGVTRNPLGDLIFSDDASFYFSVIQSKDERPKVTLLQRKGHK